MTKAEEKEVRRVVQDELLAILQDAHEALGGKDPTGMGKKALEALSALIRRRQQQQAAPQDQK